VDYQISHEAEELKWHHNSMNHDHHPLGGCKYICESGRTNGKRAKLSAGRRASNDWYAMKRCLELRLVTLFSRLCQNCHGLEAVLGASHEMAQTSGGINCSNARNEEEAGEQRRLKKMVLFSGWVESDKNEVSEAPKEGSVRQAR